MLSPFELEILAMRLYRDVVVSRQSARTTQQRIKEPFPSWNEIGVKLRNEYRNTVKQLVKEQQP